MTTVSVKQASLVLLNEYSNTCLANKVPDNFSETESFWKLELEAVSVDLTSYNQTTLKRIVFCLSRLKQINSSFDLVKLDSAFSQLLAKHADKHRGCVLTFGKNDFQLGSISDNPIQSVPHRIVNEEKVSFEQVSAARFHSMAVSCTGKLYTWGQGQGGRLGHGNEETYIIPTKVSLPSKVVSIATGKQHSMALLEGGCLCTWGSNKYGQLGLGNTASVLTPTKVCLSKKRGYSGVLSISASNSHSMCIKEDGSVYSWGKNNSCQLGFRSIASNGFMQKTPFKVSSDAFQGLVPDSCAISEDISLVLTLEGKVFQWGKGSPTPTKVVFSREVDCSKGKKSSEWNVMRETSKSIVLTSISTAPFHSAAISNHGEVFTWGTETNLLGYATSSHTTLGRRIDYFFDRGIKIESIDCAKRHNVVVDSKGYVYVWGHGDQGALGLTAKQTYQPEPTVIPSLRSVKAVAAAECHTCVIVKEMQPLSQKEQESLELKLETVSLESLSDDESVQSLAEVAEESKKEVSVEKSEVTSSLQLMCEKYLLKEADIWNILNYLAFGLKYNLREIIRHSELLILLNLPLLIANQSKFLKALAEIYGFTNLLKHNVTVTNSNKTSTTERRYSLPPVKSIPTPAIVPKETKRATDKKFKSPKPTIKTFTCDACGITTSSESSKLQHLSGKLHKKKAKQKTKFQFQIASPPTPRYKPTQTNQPVPIELPSEKPRFNLSDFDFPKPSRVLTATHKAKREPLQTPVRKTSNTGYSLSDFISKRRGRAAVKPCPWKEPSKGKPTLSSIMTEQSREVKDDKCLKQSSWGYNKVKTTNLISIQDEEVEANFIREQKKLLRKFKRQQAKARRKAKQQQKRNLES